MIRGNKKISFIGIGRLGSAFALLCEKNGYDVLGADKRADYVDQLNKKEFKTPEPQIEELLKESKSFRATTNIIEAIEHSDLLFIFVPTPSKDNGEYDHQHIEEVVDDLMDYRSDGGNIAGKTLVIGSTVMPGYCKSLSEELEPFGVEVTYNPEFIKQGEVISGLQRADFVLIGRNVSVPARLFDVYNAIMLGNPIFKILTLTAAEITKIAINCYLTMKISFANMIGEIAIESGESGSVNEILKVIGEDSRIGNKFLNYGFGFSGVCLPRDNKALGVHAYKVHVTNIIPKTIDYFNEDHYYFILRKFMEANPDKEFPFIFNQLSYKKNVDILTDSQHYRLCKQLLQEGYKVNINESESVINAVKKELEIYGDRVIYGNGIGTVSNNFERMVEGQRKRGYVIDL